jgi:putative Ca2+/H+ antiporter (TMEM165/GDT1 family)
MLKEAYSMTADEGQTEYEEVQKELSSKEEELDCIKVVGSTTVTDTSSGTFRATEQLRQVIYMFFSRIFVQSCTLTFLAEWGDRSQISTIILAARDNVVGVIIGGTLGHALCTGLAVIGGRFIAQRISMRTVTFIGGIVFIIFAISALVLDSSS